MHLRKKSGPCNPVRKRVNFRLQMHEHRNHKKKAQQPRCSQEEDPWIEVFLPLQMSCHLRRKNILRAWRVFSTSKSYLVASSWPFAHGFHTGHQSLCTESPGVYASAILSFSLSLLDNIDSRSLVLGRTSHREKRRKTWYIFLWWQCTNHMRWTGPDCRRHKASFFPSVQSYSQRIELQSLPDVRLDGEAFVFVRISSGPLPVCKYAKCCIETGNVRVTT